MSRRASSPRQVFVLVGSVSLLASLNYSLVFIAFGEIEDSFSSSPATVSWALTAFSITVAALLIPSGWCSDRYGRTRVFLVGLSLFTVGSALVAGAPTVAVLIVGRVVQAVGLALESTASLAILLDAFPVHRRSTAVGLLGATGGAAATIGPVVGGALVDAIGWRWTFALNVPAGLALLALTRRRLPVDPPRRVGAPPDLVGVVLLAVGVGALALSIVELNAWGVTDRRIVLAVVVAATALTVTVDRSRRHPDPILYLPLFADRQFRLGSLLNFLVAGSFSGAFYTFIRLLTDGWGLSVTEAGIAIAVIPLLGGPLSFVAGRIADRRGHRGVIVAGTLAMALGSMWLAIGVQEQKSIPTVWFPVALLYGVGVGLGHAACQAAALRDVASDRLGIGGATSRICMEIGGVISVAVAVALLSSAGDVVQGARHVAVLLVCLMLVSAALATRLSPARVAPRSAAPAA